MCEICGTSPCLPGCPNAEAAKSGYICDLCGESILAGDEMVELFGVHYHKDCFEDLSPVELLELIGGEVMVAEEAESLWEM